MLAGVRRKATRNMNCRYDAHLEDNHMRLMRTPYLYLFHTSDTRLCIIPVPEYYHQVNTVHPSTRYILLPSTSTRYTKPMKPHLSYTKSYKISMHMIKGIETNIR